LKFLQNDSLANSKFGIIIPKKAIKLSVNRNRVKRVFRAALADLIKNGGFKKVGFYVFFVSDEKLVEVKKDNLELSLRA
jgi:ribonuclease P protein component